MHEDLVVYSPRYKIPLTVRLAEEDLSELRRSLQKYTLPGSGLPFTATFIDFLNCKVFPVFNRIKRTNKTKLAGFKSIKTYRDMLLQCQALFTEPSEFVRMLDGSAELNMEEYFVARLLNNYVLFKPFITYATLDKAFYDYDKRYYTLTFRVLNRVVPGYMDPELIFDPTVDPERCSGEVTLLGLFPIGLLDLNRRLPIPILALAKGKVDIISEQHEPVTLHLATRPTIRDVVNAISKVFVPAPKVVSISRPSLRKIVSISELQQLSEELKRAKVNISYLFELNYGPKKRLATERFERFLQKRKQKRGSLWVQRNLYCLAVFFIYLEVGEVVAPVV